ncbi:hypothetical protein J6590_011594 [Homalodisca vitripennis]|nr:hypothetical protein J6590_011594 [Homalodisca vitripennis]
MSAGWLEIGAIARSWRLAQSYQHPTLKSGSDLNLDRSIVLNKPRTAPRRQFGPDLPLTAADAVDGGPCLQRSVDQLPRLIIPCSNRSLGLSISCPPVDPPLAVIRPCVGYT